QRATSSKLGAFFCFVHEKDTGSYRNSNFSKSCDRFYATLMPFGDLFAPLARIPPLQVPFGDLFASLARIAPLQVPFRDLFASVARIAPSQVPFCS
ncbi:hypothetical protein, partial [Paenibacillus lactis]|uniref:hypothetical protein n=1 Tax=Paenibacillus lactis TaxID=228574 RepID=UPI001BCC8BD6